MPQTAGMGIHVQTREEQRFGAGLPEAEVVRFQSILREQCGVDLSLQEAWGRAIELLSLVEMVLYCQGVLGQSREGIHRVRTSSLLTDSRVQ